MKRKRSPVEDTIGADAEARDTEAGSDTAKGRNRGDRGSRTTGAATGTGAGARIPKEPHEGTEEREGKEEGAGG